MILRICLLIISIIFFHTGLSSAAGRIIIRDNWKTSDSVLRRVIDGKEIKQAVRSLDALRVFHPVTTSKTNGDLIYSIKDKWTALPSFTMTRGGEAVMYTVGLFDDNFLGSLGSIYLMMDVTKGYGENKGTDADSWSGFFSSSRFMGYNLLINFGLYNEEQQQFLYSSEGLSVGSFLFRRSGFSLEVGREFWKDISFSLRVSLLEEKVRDRSGEGISFFPMNNANRWEWSILMKVNHSIERFYRMKGSVFQALLQADSDGGGYIYINFRHYFLIDTVNNLALRFSAGTASGNSFGQQFVAGGQDSFRGFYHRSFIGRNLIRANAEYRHHLGVFSMFDTDLLYWQWILFADGGTVFDSISHPDNSMIASVGFGLRIAAIPISDSVLRIDFSWGLTPYKRFDVVVGTKYLF